MPVPKKGRPADLNDYRPVALTSHIMKTMERIVLSHLRSLVITSLDPLQFAYCPKVGVEDAIIYMLQRIYPHLDKPGCSVRILFFDFSSAFNTIHPALLGKKLADMQVDTSMISWVIDYLTGRPQFVRLRNCVSQHVVSNIGAPQGTVLSPFLFTLYTSDFHYNTQLCHLQKFSDDTAVVGCIEEGHEMEYRTLITSFVEWCEANRLQLNVTKTKEMEIDFRRKKAQLIPICISDCDVEIVDSYKYLGVHIDNKLNWTQNTEAIYRKGQSRLYFLRRLRSFNVCKKMLTMFYQSVVASSLFYAVLCWGSGAKVKHTNQLNKLIKKASSIIGEELVPLEVVAEKRIMSKLLTILDNTSHPLHDVFVNLRSNFSWRLIPPRCKSERYRKSFVPTAIRLYNASSIH